MPSDLDVPTPVGTAATLPTTFGQQPLVTATANCQVPVPRRQSGSGTYATLPRGLGRCVGPAGTATGVGELT
jgi:hypothetical protein